MGEQDQYNLSLILEALKPSLNGYGKVAFYQEIARRLSQSVNRSPAWSWRYIYGVQQGQMNASKELSRAIAALGAMIDGVPAVLANTEMMAVHAQPGKVRPGSLILGQSRYCSYPPCGISFVPAWATSIYCCPEHRRLERNRVRRERRRQSGGG